MLEFFTDQFMGLFLTRSLSFNYGKGRKLLG